MTNDYNQGYILQVKLINYDLFPAFVARAAYLIIYLCCYAICLLSTV